MNWFLDLPMAVRKDDLNDYHYVVWVDPWLNWQGVYLVWYEMNDAPFFVSNEEFDDNWKEFYPDNEPDA